MPGDRNIPFEMLGEDMDTPVRFEDGAPQHLQEEEARVRAAELEKRLGELQEKLRALTEPTDGPGDEAPSRPIWTLPAPLMRRPGSMLVLAPDQKRHFDVLAPELLDAALRAWNELHREQVSIRAKGWREAAALPSKLRYAGDGVVLDEDGRRIAGEVGCDLTRALVDLWNEWGPEGTARQLRPLEDWHEDFGPVLWWRLPIEEPPWCGTPLDSDWQIGGNGPGGAYYTHWTRLPDPILSPDRAASPHAPREAPEFCASQLFGKLQALGHQMDSSVGVGEEQGETILLAYVPGPPHPFAERLPQEIGGYRVVVVRAAQRPAASQSPKEGES